MQVCARVGQLAPRGRAVLCWRAAYSTKPPPATVNLGSAPKPPAAPGAAPIAPSAKPSSGLHPVPLLLLVGGISLAGFVATNPDSAREVLGKAGLRDALEPFVAVLGGASKQNQKDKGNTPVTERKATGPKPAAPEASNAARKDTKEATIEAPKASAPPAPEPASPVPVAAVAPSGPSLAAKAMKAAEEDLRVQLSTKLEALDGVALGASVLRATLAADLLADLEELDRSALVYRLGNLTNELRERAKWEALRSHDAWRRAEVEQAAKHDLALHHAKQDMARKHLQQLSLARADGERRLAESVGERELTIARQDHEVLEQEANKVKDYLEAVHAAEESALAEAAAVARGQAMVDAAAAACGAAIERAGAASELALQAEALGAELAAGKELTSTGAALQRSSAQCLAGALPGASPSLASLQRSFEGAQAAGLKAALIPKGFEGTGLGRFLGGVLASVHVTSAAAQGSPEALLAEAKAALEAEKLSDAMALLSRLEGPPAAEMADWVRDASRRLAADKNLAELAAK